MTYAAKILADSIAFGVRLTTIEVTFPRYILAEVNTHRMLSRNSASSRAIPVETRIKQVRENPFVPEAFGKNKSGMQASEALDEREQILAREHWLDAARHACDVAARLADLGAHKQHANRVLEPFCWHTAVITATEWANFFALRCHPAAQPEMQITARLMRAAMEQSTPKHLDPGEWHLPYVDVDERPALCDAYAAGLKSDPSLDDLVAMLRAVSVARCAAISFDRQHVEKPVGAYIARHDSMMELAHWSPFEHQAKVGVSKEVRALAMMTERGVYGPAFIGNFRAPWIQYRKTLAGEAVFGGGAT